MNQCLWCDNEVRQPVSWHYIFGLSEKHLLCEDCRGGLRALIAPLCEICGRPLAELEAAYHKDGVCYDCVRWKDSSWANVLYKNRSLYHYNTFLKEVMARYKFRGDAVIAEGFGFELKRLYDQEFKGKIIVPIPLSKERLYQRGFNQALLLATQLETPICEALHRPVHELKQSKKSREQRVRQKEPVFQASEMISEIKGEEVVIIDDIYTTGATIRQAASVLKAGGAASASSLTLARG